MTRSAKRNGRNGAKARAGRDKPAAPEERGTPGADVPNSPDSPGGPEASGRAARHGGA
ncbi:hypothetical protein [Streptomyces globisporus]|uniref:hypothetical protein n=1 Tax=Streptomyces globisporus TaxID=1908 RepID=UPI00382A667F